MGEKSKQKKQFILNEARKVFMEKGFSNVTMKDIVDACEISRGGLYLYFSSTTEIFLEVLKMETEEADDVFQKELGEEATASDILAVFLREQKRELLQKKNTLIVAKYEFFFNNKVPRKDNLVKKQFDTAVKIIEQLITAGTESGEFYCEDPLGMARNIMYVLEGLKISAHTMGISAETVDRELCYIMQGLVIDE